MKGMLFCPFMCESISALSKKEVIAGCMFLMAQGHLDM